MNKADTNLCPCGVFILVEKKVNKQAQCKCHMKSNMEENAAGKGGWARHEDVELHIVRTSLEPRINEVRALGRYLRKSI